MVPSVAVSVIVPCYKVEDYVRPCIESILDQQFDHPFEVIAIDDGSPDRTGAILDSIAQDDFRLRVVHQDNRGLSGARNTGIASARGEALVFVDSDDMLCEGALQSLYDEWQRSSCDFVTASYEEMSEDGKRPSPIVGTRSHGAPWARLYDREVWRGLEFPEGCWFEDTVQAFCIDRRFSESYLDKSVYLYRSNNEGITARCVSSKKGLDSFWVTEAMLDWADSLGLAYDQGMHDRLVYQLGPILYARCRALDGKEMRALFALACQLYARHGFGLSCSWGGVGGA